MLIVGGGVIGTQIWYGQNLQPLQGDATKKSFERFTVNEGESSVVTAQNLEKQALIKSKTAFLWYIKDKKLQSKLQAGTYALSATMSVAEIAEHLVSGKTDSINITITPGRTIKELESDFKKYGYSTEEIEEAFSATYTSPLLADKPKSATLEGYIYPETFSVQSTDSLKTVLERDFETFYDKLSGDNLIALFKEKGLNLHQALTLASIVQRESSNPVDQKQIAQVFYKRLSMDMKLESDVTFIYAAEKLGVEPRVGLDSPYNTRLYKGLPPGPIGNMNYSALQAVAGPAQGDYLYFVAGDDGKTYFSRTVEEHEANVTAHCKKLCELY